MEAESSMDSFKAFESLDFSSSWHFSDVVLVIEDTKFHVHKCILSIWSPVFQKMFTSPFVEGVAKEIPLPGKRAGEMEVLLQFIYSSGEKPGVTAENYQFLLELAEEYQMNRVKTLCSNFLINKIESADCLDFFSVAERFNLRDVTEKCYQEVCYKLSDDLEGSQSFNNFKPEFKVDICMKVIKELESILKKYVVTCSRLVENVYKNIYESFVENKAKGKFQRGPNQKLGENHQQYHERLQTMLQRSLDEAGTSVNTADYHTKEFSLFCAYCIKVVDKIDWHNVGYDCYINLKKSMKKLYKLQTCNEVAKKILVGDV